MVWNALNSGKERLLLIYLILGFTISQAQEQSASGAASLSLAGTDLCLKDSWTSNNNPAGMTSLDNWSFSSTYESSFLIQELSLKAFVINLPLANHAIGISGQQLGFSDFNQNQIGLSYAQQFGPKLSLGLQFNYHHIQLANPYGNQSFFTANIGLSGQIDPKIKIAALIINPNRSNSFDQSKLYYPQVIKIGMAFQIEEYFSLYAQTEKELEKGLRTSIGIQYSLKESLKLRIGISDNPRQVGFGFSYHHQSIKVDIASSFNYRLGFSPAVSLTFYPRSNAH